MSDLVWAQVRSRAGRLVERPVRELRGERLEDHEAVRQPPRYQGRRAIATWWRPADRVRHAGCATLAALEAAVSLEADREVAAFASWPVRLGWAGSGEGYVPDFFVRLADGQGRLLVCRPRGDTSQRWEEASRLLEAAGRQTGWQVRVHEGLADPVAAQNMQRLSRWRHTRLADAGTARVLHDVFAKPQPLAAGVRASGLPELPTVARAHHLIWTRELLIDWSSPFVPARSLVWTPEGAG
ncbi:TnsA-like heteromeric transposase endonuclease subunit [Streptomyces sp. Ju416(a)]|uniref:TnsA-like heteromeric transposase endonuclease subunit n=1 Tax=unclassified Streptomyces TaxID=2593676 RepID=UPI0013A53E25|nr:TnsA-like heteromeric transposase endonuclease subunit [Streptomyces sp. CS014]